MIGADERTWLPDALTSILHHQLLPFSWLEMIALFSAIISESSPPLLRSIAGCAANDRFRMLPVIWAPKGARWDISSSLPESH